MNTEAVIVTDKLTKRFGPFIACNELTFQVDKGEIFGFLGANGAGKTTAMRMLCGLLNPSSGKATVAGFDVYTQANKIKQRIGYMSQRFSLYDDLTVSENIRFFAGIYGMSISDIKKKTSELLSELQLEKEAKTLVRDIPPGWKQKLAFSVSIVHGPDEPTGGVDPVTRRQFWDLIYEAADKGVTVFVTTHYMDEAEYCNRVSIMVDGVIADLDAPAALKTKYQVSSMEEVFYALARNAVRKAD
jgi:ABC-2 type transport system ATP-binding protein